MNLIANVGVQGSFKLQRRDANLNLIEESGESSNLVLEQGLDRMSQGTFGGYVVVGSNNTPPTIYDNGIIEKVAHTNSTIGGATRKNTVAPMYHEYSITYRFAKGAAQGNLAEVGWGWGGNTNELFDRALIKDSAGNPTTITILANEFLDVIFTMRYYYNPTHWTQTIYLRDELNNVLDTLEVDAYVDMGFTLPTSLDALSNNRLTVWYSQVRCGAWTGNSAPYGNSFYAAIGNLGTELVAASGLVNSTPNTSSPAWATPNGTNSYPTNRSCLWKTKFPIADRNNGIIGAHLVTTLGFFKYKMDKLITKDNTQTLELSALISWDRYTPPGP